MSTAPTTRLPWYALDARSLAATRIGLGTLLLLDLGLRASDLTAHYTDAGVLPRALIPAGSWDFAWSVHRLGGSTGFEALLFAVHAVVALLLVLGWKTFWTSLGTTFLTISLHGRNPLLRDGQDDLLRVLLVWGTLLPWGTRWSLDARADRVWHPLGIPPGPWVTTPAAAGFLLQLMLVYWASAIAKLESSWWQSGEGLSLALSMGRYETLFGKWLLGIPALLPPMNWGALAFELLAPLLVLAGPRPRWRLGTVVAFWMLHALLGTMLRLGTFPLVAAAAWSALLPGNIWPAKREPTLEAAETVQGSGGSRCLTPRFSRFAGSIGWGLVGGLLAVVVLFNATYLWPRGTGVRLEPVQLAARVVGLQQYWSLFSPPWWMHAARVDGWFSVPADRADGHSIELLTGGADLSLHRPRLGSDLFPNRRWRHWAAALMEEWPRGTLQRRTVEEARLTTVRWWCRTWNEDRPPSERVGVVRLVWMRQRLGHPEDPPEPRLLAQGVCEVGPSGVGG
jgi:hypothetical protein